MAKNLAKWEFGDYQTSPELAQAVCQRIRALGCNPRTIIEPTCGYGNFVFAALKVFPEAEHIYAFDINPRYIENLNERLKDSTHENRVKTFNVDFFRFEWGTILDSVQWPLLVIGNPPWVTSAELSTLNSQNLPDKNNFQKHKGFDAVTGKSNFDISEWMLLKHIEWLEGRAGTIAMLCKTAVARKILKAEWRKGETLYNPRMFGIDTLKEFNVSVDACLFVCESADKAADKDCSVYTNLTDFEPATEIGFRHGYLVSDADTFDAHEEFLGNDPHYKWRSGVKHDCASIMELQRSDEGLFNGLGERVDVELDLVYPLLKSSEVAGGKRSHGKSRYVLVTQTHIGEDTSKIKSNYPRTWGYLNSNKQRLDKRSSQIYKTNPQFSIFGIGPYAFAPWKVAISGLYKYLKFTVVGPRDNKPTMVDDTVYFLPCQSEEEAQSIAKWLNSPDCQEWLESMIFWKDKRPVTIDLLKRINIRNIAKAHKEEHFYDLYTCQNQRRQKSLWELT